jgi:hypothetical protein
VHLLTLDARTLDAHGGVCREIAPLDGVPEHLAERRERVRDRARAAAEAHGPRIAVLLFRRLRLELARHAEALLEARSAGEPVIRAEPFTY